VRVPRPLATARQAAERLTGRRGEADGAWPTLPQDGPPGGLVLGPDTQPHLTVRDPAAALNFFRFPPGSQPSTDEAAHQERPPQVTDSGWYHSIELPDGVVTEGLFDHRALVPHYGLPETLAGKRALDVATFDGFWAFELERRGAAVTAIDLELVSQVDLPEPVQQQRRLEGVDLPVAPRFEVARQSLGSRVTRIRRSVYDLSPDDLGTFDLVHVADLLLHLRSPIAALTAIRSVTQGELLLSDVFRPDLSRSGDDHLVQYVGGWDNVVWWMPSLDTLAQMIVDAGFVNVRTHATYNLAHRQGVSGFWRVIFKAQA
jgi:tRNA (mo5U34)-methyltransferase